MNVKSKAGVIAGPLNGGARASSLPGGGHADPGNRAQAEDRLGSRAAIPLASTPSARIVPATSGTSQAKNRKRAK